MTDSGEAAASDVEPASIEVDREAGVTASWADGHVAELGLYELRVSCPCAGCHELRRAGEVAWPRPGSPATLRIVDARLVGAFGIAFDWNDGHSTGIYGWERLRHQSGG